MDYDNLDLALIWHLLCSTQVSSTFHHHHHCLGIFVSFHLCWQQRSIFITEFCGVSRQLQQVWDFGPRIFVVLHLENDATGVCQKNLSFMMRTCCIPDNRWWVCDGTCMKQCAVRHLLILTRIPARSSQHHT
jgi:hypothetical protein